MKMIEMTMTVRELDPFVDGDMAKVEEGRTRTPREETCTHQSRLAGRCHWPSADQARVKESPSAFSGKRWPQAQAKMPVVLGKSLHWLECQAEIRTKTTMRSDGKAMDVCMLTSRVVGFRQKGRLRQHSR